MTTEGDVVVLTEADIVESRSLAAAEIERKLASGEFMTVLAITAEEKIVLYYSDQNPPHSEKNLNPNLFSIQFVRCCCNSINRRGMWLLNLCWCGVNRCW